MKIIILSLLLSSCTMYQVTPTGEQFGNAWEIVHWIHERVEYRMDYINYWRSPREVLRDGYGDCEDYTLLFMAMVNEAWGWKPEMLLVKIDGYKYWHYICRYDGILYDITGYFIGEKYPFKITVLDRIGFDVAMWWATLGYTKNIKGEVCINGIKKAVW